MRRDDRGATAVELALVLPVLLMVVFMTVYGGLYLFYGTVAEHVARAAARDASIRSGGTSSPYPSTADVTAAAKQAAHGLLPAPTTVGVSSDPPRSAPLEGDSVTVTVTYDLPAVASIGRALWFLPGAARSTLTRSAVARRE